MVIVTNLNYAGGGYGNQILMKKRLEAPGIIVMKTDGTIALVARVVEVYHVPGSRPLVVRTE